jgi:hypothetical protein
MPLAASDEEAVYATDAGRTEPDGEQLVVAHPTGLSSEGPIAAPIVSSP